MTYDECRGQVPTFVARRPWWATRTARCRRDSQLIGACTRLTTRSIYAFVHSRCSSLLKPEEVGALVVQPVERASVAFQIATVVRTESHGFRIPVITSDATAAWTAEGSDITHRIPV